MDFNALLSPLMRKVLVGVLTTAIFPITHWLIAKGIISQEDSTTFIAEILAMLLSGAAAVWAASHQQKRENTANANDPMTSSQLDEKLKNKETAPVSVPSNTIPQIKPVLAFMLLTLGLSVGCATVQTNPTAESQAKVREQAGNIYVAAEAGLKIVDTAGTFLNSLPVSNDVKNDIDCSIVRVTGTTEPRPALLKICGPSTPQGPGPLDEALVELKTVTTTASLKTTVGKITAAVNPLLTKLEASDQMVLKALGASLRATLSVVFSFSGGQ